MDKNIKKLIISDNNKKLKVKINYNNNIYINQLLESQLQWVYCLVPSKDHKKWKISKNLYL